MQTPDRVELRDGPEGLLEAWHGERRLAVLVERPHPTGPSFVLAGRAAPIDPGEVAGLLDTLKGRAAANDGPPVELVTNDPLVRELARHRGFAGSLRDPLTSGAPGLTTRTDDPAGLRDAVQSLLPEIAVGVERTAGAARSLLRRAVSGVPNTVNLFAAPDDRAVPTRFAVPRRNDLLVEAVARCIDTTMAVRRRFGVPAVVRRVSFDHSDFNLLHGSHAGSADRSSGAIHMNASLASLEGLTTLEHARATRGGGSASVPAPFNQIDGTTAHEMWHQMEGSIESRRGLGIELRRRLGEALGVETLEQAVNGGRPRSPGQWKAANARLVDEVSSYAATTPVEATAEMFKLWWCANGERSPIVERFGELVEPLLDSFNA